MFTISEANTSDRCKELKSWYQSTLQENTAKTSSLCSSINDATLPDIVNAGQSPLITNHLSDSNNSQLVFSTDEPLYEDPGCVGDEVCSWLKGRKTFELMPHEIK